MPQSFHLVMSISGALKLPRRELRNTFIDPETGQYLSPDAARAELLRMQAEGLKVVPNADCDNRGPDGRCLGHPSSEGKSTDGH